MVSNALVDYDKQDWLQARKNMAKLMKLLLNVFDNTWCMNGTIACMSMSIMWMDKDLVMGIVT